MFRRKGLEVLYLYEPVDEFALETLAKYKDYTFKAVEHADSAVLDAFADTDEQPKACLLYTSGKAGGLAADSLLYLHCRLA